MKTKTSMRKLPNVLNKEQLKTLIEAIDDPHVMLGVLLGAFCGLRIGEIARLKKEHIDFDRKILKVVNGKLAGKNDYGYGKDRIVPVPSKIIMLLQAWCEIGQGTYLLESISRINQPMTHQHLFKKYRRTLVKAGLSILDREDSKGRPVYRYNFHTLRHTYATLLWEKSGDIYAVKQVLGHVKLDTTMVYTHISDKTLQRKVENAFEGIRIPIQKQQVIEEVKVQNPVDLIKIRLAKGEITIENYNKIINALKE